MCMSGVMYEFEEEDDFYNKTDDKWDYYSGLPNPLSYVE